MTATVILENLSVSFHRHEVLHGVSAFFPARAVSVVVGRSGSGKTTLLRAINRLNEEFPGCVTTGAVQVDLGQGMCDVYSARALPLPHLRQRVGMLFQTPNCFPVSAYRNLAMPLALVGGVAEREIPARVQSALEAVGLWQELKSRLDTPAERLSGGQQQRLCLARLLALQPSVLLLDEPTASLDVHASRDIEELLCGLAQQYTIIMVSHGLPQARRMADQLLVCQHGRITGAYADPAALDERQLAEMLESVE